MVRSIRLVTDGDRLERRCWPLFIEHDFPSYERFWVWFVVPLTNRDAIPPDVHFKMDTELGGLTPPRDFFDIYLAQLNYSVIWHLSAAYAMRATAATRGWESQLFVHTIIRLCSALDVADELLQLDNAGRPIVADPWNKAQVNRSRWRKAHSHPYLAELQKYRNQLIHSGPFMHWEEGPIFPRVGRHSNYWDWRKASGPLPRRAGRDFAHAAAITEDAWKRTTRYLNRSWSELLRGRKVSRKRLRPIEMETPSADMPLSREGIVSTTTPTFAVGHVTPFDLTVLDAPVESHPRSSTSIPWLEGGSGVFWDPRVLDAPLGDVTGSSTTPFNVAISASSGKSRQTPPPRPPRGRRSKGVQRDE